MSMHKIPLTELERDGLLKHGLDIGTPSQLSDVFRLGIKFALSKQSAIEQAARAEALEDAAEICENESSSYDVAIDAMNGCAEKIRLLAEKEQAQ